MASSAGEPERPDERRRSEAVGERHGPHPAAAGKWIVDFGLNMSAGDAALYEEPFRWVKEHVWPTWDKQREAERRDQWWLHHRPRPNMWAALGDLSRYIATPRVAKYRLFVWLDARVCPDSATIAIARDDDTTFGILHSRFHEIWSLRRGTWLGKGNDPRYTPTTTFETFPFPPGLTPNTPASDYAADPRAGAVALAAAGSPSCATAGSTRPSGSSGWPSRCPATQGVRSRAMRMPRRLSRNGP